MRTAGGDDLPGFKAETAFRQRVSGPVQCRVQLLQSTAPLTLPGLAAGVCPVQVQIDRKRRQVEGLSSRKFIANDKAARTGVIGIALMNI